MSERDIRTIIGDDPVMSHKYNCERQVVGSTHYPDGLYVECSCGLDAALAAEPDIAALLERLVKLQEAEEQAVRDLTANELDSEARIHEYAAAQYEHLAGYIRFTFNLRLTDDGGWEWVD